MIPNTDETPKAPAAAPDWLDWLLYLTKEEADQMRAILAKMHQREEMECRRDRDGGLLTPEPK